jgi:VWA domain containing CoxE-like protein
MSATVTAPAAPAPAWLAAPAGDWKTLSDAMTAEVPAIAGRPVPVACAPGAGLGSPACYLRDIPVIEVDGDLLEPDPGDCDPAIPGDRERYPVTWGALIHECAHAAHTQVRIPGERRANWCQAARQLEESRIEYRQAGRRPADRRYLRALITKLILDDFKAAGAEPGGSREAGTAAALLLAREDAGILDPGETAPVADGVEAAIGTEALARLRATWREFHATADDDLRTRIRLARRWCRILGLDPDAAPPAPLVIMISSELAKILARAIRAIAEAVAADFAPPPPPFPPDAADKREHEKAARINAERAAREVFGRKTQPRAVTGTREPDTDEAAAARRLTRALREATAGERATTTVTSKVPPGRLRMGKALASRAQRAAGAVPTAEPFTSTRRRRVPAPPLRVGVACDISGSMGAYTGPVASAAWILAAAAWHLPSALTASVLFGKGVYALTRPGERPAQVTDFTATASTESACRAIDALDGALALAAPGTARLLVIVSDTSFVAEGEPAGVQQRITRLHRAGCGVIILTPRGWASICTYTDCQVIETSRPADAIDAIARAAARALTT